MRRPMHRHVVHSYVTQGDRSMKFRKKPVVIDAVQWDGNLTTVEALMIGASTGAVEQNLGDPALYIPTLEGTHRADVGDWIIKGVKGELYPCKPDIFAATYDATSGEPVPCWCPYCGEPHSVAQRASK